MSSNRKEEILEISISLIGIFLLLYLLWSIDFRKIIDTISKANLHLIILSTLLILVRIPLSVYKWNILAKDQGVDVEYIKMMKFYLVGFFFTNVTPGGVGNYIRVKFLHDSGKDFGVAISNIVIDNLIEMMSLHTLALIALSVFFPEKTGLILLVLLLMGTAVIPLLLLLEGKIGGRLTKSFVIPFVPREYRRLVRENIDKIFSKPPSIRSIAISFAISIFTWTVCFIQIYPIFLSLGIGIDLLDSLSLWSISISISALPITVGGLGVREWFMIYLSSKYSISNSLAISASLLGYFIIFLVPSIIGGLLLTSNLFPNLRDDRRR
ncbi:MAG TPA: flippase-like domain-containing protein [Thermoplasmatales archaeon]|nr:flippase-like domain-containing protein [Thermoplasmatales archaeon]